MTGPVHLDLTEIVGNPIRSGIQRVERELIRNWPRDTPLLPCRFDAASGEFQILPERVFDVLTADGPASGGGFEADRETLAVLARRGRPFDRRAPARRGPTRLLNLETFYDPRRAEAYLDCRANPGVMPFWVVIDFLPFLSPHLYPSGTTRHCMHFIRAVRSIRRVGFISGVVRDDYARRIMRRPRVDGPVLPLGGDALRLPRQSFAPEKRSFVVIGTVEPKKNLCAILTAFAGLWERGCEAELVVAGRLTPAAVAETKLLDSLSGQKRLRRLHSASDAQIAAALAGARATVFVSDGEGFGIPPFESLHAGIPVIVRADIPSIALLPPAGQVRLATTDPDAIADAVLHLMDDAVAARLWREAAGLRVPGWRDFATSVAEWTASG